jgi:hypothetical protein
VRATIQRQVPTIRKYKCELQMAYLAFLPLTTDFPAQIPHRKWPIFFSAQPPHTPCSAHNPAQDIQPVIAHRCEDMLANKGILSYTWEQSIATSGNYEQ